MRPLLALSLLAGTASLAATAACSSDSGPNVTADVSIVAGASGLGANAFDPNPLTQSIATKATVTWVNNDGVTHRVISDAPLFDSANLSGGDNYTFTFTAAGTYTYHCSIHPTMVGTITINP